VNKQPDDEREQLSLTTAAQQLLEECRMVLPGIQALFGFQLIAVFSAGFEQSLNKAQQELHLFAILLVAVAIALIMTPAALHRAGGAHEVTSTFIAVSSALLLASMAPLAIGICVEVYLVAAILTNSELARIFAVALFLLFIGLWFVFPRMERLQRLVARTRG
jgi:Family of unknown function (DUF6328)